MIFCIIAVGREYMGVFFLFLLILAWLRWKKGWKPIHRFDNILFPLLAYEGEGAY